MRKGKYILAFLIALVVICLGLYSPKEPEGVFEVSFGQFGSPIMYNFILNSDSSLELIYGISDNREFLFDQEIKEIWEQKKICLSKNQQEQLIDLVESSISDIKATCIDEITIANEAKEICIHYQGDSYSFYYGFTSGKSEVSLIHALEEYLQIEIVLYNFN